ncbi:MAG TPA: phage tail protein, partial [Allosphingosinicella sp.]
PDPLIASAEGLEQAPAFRGIAYAVFEELDLADFGNRIPSLTFELVADDGPVMVGAIAESLSNGALAAGETSPIAGFAASGDSVRGAIEDLAESFGLSLADNGAQLLLARPSASVLLIDKSTEAGRREVVRRAAATLPREVTVTYYDPARDYQTGLQRASAGGGAEARGERRALPAVLDALAAKAVAEQRLERLWAGRVSSVATLGWSSAGIRAGSLVELEGEGGLWRVQRATVGPMTVRLELLREAAGSTAASIGATPGRVFEQPDLPLGPTVILLHELPSIDGLAERPVAVALASGEQPGWRKAALSVSFDSGASWTDLGATAAPAVLGTSMTGLPAAGSALLDLDCEVDVELLNDAMKLLSRDDDALVGGANLALIGDELVQFGRAEKVGERTYRLSRLLRGRRGTEGAAAGHFVGEDFALIDPRSARVIDLPMGLGLGSVVDLLALGVGDDEPVHAVLTLTGETLRPPAPVHVSAVVADGGTQISWVRRSRQGWTWVSGADTPLAEEQERYRLTFNGLRCVETASPSYFYGAGERAGDGAAPVTVEIAQLGTHAASRATTIIIP